METENQLLMGEMGNPPATRLYHSDHCDQPGARPILHEDIRAAFAGAGIWEPWSEEYKEFMCGEHDIEEKDVPRTPGWIVGVCQVQKNGSGYIRVRWGDYHARGSILAEYHFSAGKV